jgi:transposase
MGKQKHSLETRLAVVNHYLAGNDGTRGTAELFGVDRTSVRRWSRTYQYHGIDGFSGNSATLSPEFRVTVIQAIISDALSVREATARFNISNESVVQHWIRVYKEAGLTGLLKLKRGRARKVTKKSSKQPQTNKELEKLSPEELRAEIRYLQAENAYLKKLKALVQREINGKKPE